MKIATVIEILLISIVIAFVSCKSIESMGDTSGMISNVTASSSEVLRQALPNEPSIEVVQELVDSDEVLTPDAPQLLEDEIQNNVDELVPEKPAVNDPEPASVSVESTQSSVVENNEVSQPVNENDPNPINKYCSCTSAQCKCCRDFALPIIPIRGPGCATIRYLNDDRVAVTIKYGDFVLTQRTIDSRRAAPICVPLPGGFNRFCGRIYGISRRDENFKACLGLELRAEDEVEASLRVSCFQFGPRGLATIDAEPLPPLENEGGADDDDDDEDDGDFLGLDALAGGEDDDDEDDAGDAGDLVGDVLGDDDDDDGIGGGLLRGAEDFFGSFFESDNNKKKKPSSAIKVNRKTNKVNLKKLKKIPTLSTTESAEATTYTNQNGAASTKTKQNNKEGIIGELESAVDEYDLEEEEAEKQEEKEEELADEKEQEKEDSYEDDDDDDDDDDSEDDEYNEVRHTQEQKKKTKSSSSFYGLGFLGRVLSFFY